MPDVHPTDGAHAGMHGAAPSLKSERFDIAGWRVEVATISEEARNSVRDVLRGFSGDRASDDALHRYELVQHPTGSWHLHVVDDETTYEDHSLVAALGRLEWLAVNAALANREGFFCLHGAALGLPLDRSGVVLVGGSGRGKTTLALGLMLRGFAPFSDDVCLIDPRTLELHALRRAFHVGDGTWAALEPLGGPRRPSETVAGFFSPPQWASAPVPVRWVLFPEYRPQQKPALIPLSASEAAREILAETLRFERAPRLALEMAARLTENAGCFRFLSGDLSDSVAMVQHLVGLDDNRTHLAQR
jgi:hypothetical protein